MTDDNRISKQKKAQNFLNKVLSGVKDSTFYGGLNLNQLEETLGRKKTRMMQKEAFRN